MRPLYLFVGLALGAVWLSCGGTDNSGLFVGGTGGFPGAGGNVTGGSGKMGSGGSVSSTGAGGGASGSAMTAGAGGAAGAAGKGGGGVAGQAGSGMGGAAGKGGSAGMAGSATAGMAGSAGTAIIDAGSDVVRMPEAGPGPTIRCGTTSCDPTTHFCCLADPRVCVPNGTDGCDSNRNRLHCDDASDCDPGQHCCLVDNNNGLPNDAVCRNSCFNFTTRPVQMLCDPLLDQCPNSDPICSANGMSIVPTYAFCH